jgi:hypothetical protein
VGPDVSNLDGKANYKLAPYRGRIQPGLGTCDDWGTSQDYTVGAGVMGVSVSATDNLSSNREECIQTISNSNYSRVHHIYTWYAPIAPGSDPKTLYSY